MSEGKVRTAPQDAGAERVLLAGMLTDAEEVFGVCGERLRPELFYIRSHRLLFETLMEMREKKMPLEVSALFSRLKDTGKLEEVGGMHAVSEIASAFVTSTNADFYVKQLDAKLRLRRVIESSTSAIQKAYERQDEPEQILAEIETAAFDLCNSRVAGDNELAWACEEFLEQVEAREHGEGAKLGLQTSLRAWNEIFGGIQPAQYYAIGGRPGAGKSALAEQFAQEQALAGVPVLYISSELRRDRVIARMAARQAEVNLAAFLRGGSRREERLKLRDALAKLRAAKFWLINPSDITGGQIRSLTRRLKRQMGIGLAVFDYLQLVQIPEGKERWEGIAAASVEIRKTVNETGVPFLALVQLNREAERESRPRMGHIKEASQVEQDCDAVILLRAEKDEQDPSGFYPVLANVDKNRWGSTCEVQFMFHGRTLTFKNAAEKRESDFL